MQDSNKIRVDFFISHALPWALRLPDSNYECKYGQNRYSLSTKTLETHIADVATADAIITVQAKTGQITEASKSHIPGAMLRYTEFTIAFTKNISESAVRQADFKDVLLLTHTFLNRFLDCYRTITNDTEVRPLTRAEFYQFRAGQGLSVRCNIKNADGSGTLGMGVFFDEENPAVMGKPEMLKDSEVAELRKHLYGGDVPALTPLLLLNAAMHLRSGESKIAVIEMNTAFDVVVEQKAKELLLHLGHPPEEVRNKLERKNAAAIMKTIILPHIDPSSQKDLPWDEWYTNHRHLRNRVIHDGYEPKFEETQSSLENLKRLCRFVSSLAIGP